MTTQLFAKLKGKKGGNKIVFTDKEDIQKLSFFFPPIIQEDKAIEFDAERKIENDEWFYINIDEKHQNMIDPFTNCSQNTADINQILAADYSEVEALFKVNNENDKYEIIFQKITSSNRIESKRFLKLGDHPEIVEQKYSIDFSGRIDAYYDGEDKIYFRNFSTIRSLFIGIEDYYREATDEEVLKIKQNEMLNFYENFKIGIRNRKRIAAILTEPDINLEDKNFQNKIRKYAKNYPEIHLKINTEKKYIINNDKDLEIFLALVSGRYYTSELTGEKMEAKETVKLHN